MSPSRVTSVLRRLRWTREEVVVASVDAMDPGVMARAFTYFFGLGALIVAAVPLLPGRQMVEPVAVYGAVAVALVVSATCLLLYDRMPGWVLHGLPLVGTTLVSAVILGSNGSDAHAYFLMYLWVVLSGAYFFGLRTGLLHVAAIAAQSALVLSVVAMSGATVLWVVGNLAYAVTAVLLALLRERADTLILSLDAAARTDALTDLANRRAFDERLRDEIARAQRGGRPLSVVAIDLDDLKEINDTHGHAEGDDALRAVARALRHSRLADFAARIGGDEFALVLPDTDREKAALTVGRLLEEACAGPVRCSAGVAAFPADGPDLAALERAADVALYAAKAAGGRCVVSYRPELERGRTRS